MYWNGMECTSTAETGYGYLNNKAFVVFFTPRSYCLKCEHVLLLTLSGFIAEDKCPLTCPACRLNIPGDNSI